MTSLVDIVAHRDWNELWPQPKAKDRLPLEWKKFRKRASNKKQMEMLLKVALLQKLTEEDRVKFLSRAFKEEADPELKEQFKDALRLSEWTLAKYSQLFDDNIFLPSESYPTELDTVWENDRRFKESMQRQWDQNTLEKLLVYNSDKQKYAGSMVEDDIKKYLEESGYKTVDDAITGLRRILTSEELDSISKKVNVTREKISEVLSRAKDLLTDIEKNKG